LARRRRRVARADTDLNAALGDLRSAWHGAVGRAGLGIDPTILPKIAKVAYYWAKKGVLQFDEFLAKLRAHRIGEDVDWDALSADDLAAIEKAFDEGVTKATTELEIDVPFKSGKTRKLTFDEDGNMLLDGKRISTREREAVYKNLGLAHAHGGHGPARDPLTVANEARNPPYKSGMFTSERAMFDALDRARRERAAGSGVSRGGGRTEVVVEGDPASSRVFVHRDHVPGGATPLPDPPFDALDDVVEPPATHVEVAFEADGSIVSIYPTSSP
jgi:hypothetical protein